MNSKIDFCQPFKSNLAVITKNINYKPGLTDGAPRKNNMTAIYKMKTVDDKPKSDNRCTGLMSCNTNTQKEFDPGTASTPVKLHKPEQQQTVSRVGRLDL